MEKMSTLQIAQAFQGDKALLRAFRLMMKLGGAPVLEIARITGTPFDDARQMLERLEGLNLVERKGGGYDPKESYYHPSKLAYMIESELPLPE